MSAWDSLIVFFTVPLFFFVAVLLVKSIYSGVVRRTLDDSDLGIIFFVSMPIFLGALRLLRLALL